MASIDGEKISNMMVEIAVAKGRINISGRAFLVGEDLCVIISGGDSPHIGCVTLSVPRPSLSNKNKISSTTSILNLIGHMDDEAAKYVSETLASRLNKNVVVTCGIHVDNIKPEEIHTTLELIKELTDKLMEGLVNRKC